MSGFIEKLGNRQPSGKDAILASKALDTYCDDIDKLRKAALEEPKQR